MINCHVFIKKLKTIPPLYFKLFFANNKISSIIRPIRNIENNQKIKINIL